MKKSILISVFLVILGVVASLFLVPSKDEVSLIVFKEQIDSRYGEVEERYRARLDAGEVTPDVVSPLVKLYLESGAVDKAIVVMERYREVKPDDISSLKQLATLYQYAQRPDDYLEVLEHINSLQSNKDVLKSLSEIYNFNSDYEKQAQALKNMIEGDEGFDPAQVVDLASILAANQKPAEAIDALYTLQKSSSKFPVEGAELLVSLLVDSAREAEAYEVAAQFRTAGGAAPDVARLVNIIHFKGFPELAQKILDPYGDDVMKIRELLYEQVLLYLSFGRDEEAYTILGQLYAEDKMPQELLDSYMILAIRNNDEELVNELATHIQPETIGESQAISLIELAAAPKRHTLLGIIKSRLGGEVYRQAHPLFSIVLGLVLNERNMTAKIAEYVENNDLTDQQYMVIARSCARERMKACANQYLGEVIEHSPMTHQKVASIGSLYLDMREYEKGLSFVEKHRSTHSSSDVENVWVKLAASRGQKDAVRDWMTNNEDKLSYPLMTDLYFLASDNRQHSLAASVAERLYNKKATSETRSYLAHSYIKLGRFSQALELLEQNSSLSADDADNYMAALIAQAARNPSYRGELGRFASKQLARPISSQRKMSIVYALIDAGRFDIAMPYVREYALKHGGNWVYMYAENLEKQGKHEEARNFWVSLANQPGISLEQKRSIAYSLIEKGFAADAESIFLELANNASPESAEVSQLLYIWGPRMNQEQLGWLANRAQNASDSTEKAAWIKHLTDYAGDEALVRFASGNQGVLSDSVVMSQFLQALSNTGRKEEVIQYYDNVLERKLEPEQLRDLARFAGDNAFPAQALASYNALHQAAPNDLESLREIGVSAFSDSDYSEAKSYLSNYISERETNAKGDSNAEAYLPYFYYAEALRRDFRLKEAKPYYQKTLEVLESQPVKTADMEAKYYQSLVFLGQEQEGVDGLKTAIARHPEDATLKADLASTLLEMKDYAQASEAVANLSSASVKTNVAATPIQLSPALGYISYQLLNNRHEVLLAGGTANTEAFVQSLNTSHEWVSYTSLGHNKTLIVAKPEWQIDAVKGSNGGLILVPRKTASSDSASLASQQRLRNELLNARLELETDKPRQAVNRLNGLMDEYENDSQYLGFLANAENYIGRWPRALKLANKARALSPNNEDIGELQRGIERLHAQHIKLDHEWRMLGDNEEQITTLSGFATVADGVDIGIVAQNNHLNSTTIRRADGRLGDFNDDKQRGEVFLRYTKDSGSEYKASLFANNETIGAGLYYGFLNRLGKTTLSAEWNRPYWEFVENVLDDATRHRLAVDHAGRINSRLTYTGHLGYNMYEIDSGDNLPKAGKTYDGVAQSATVGGSLAYQFHDAPDVSVIYGLDAEYLTSKETRYIGATPFRPTPLRSREIHSISLAGKHDFTRRTYLEWLGGYAYDRIGGGHGPNVEGRLTHEVTDDVEVQVRASHGVGYGDADDDLTRVGAYIMYRY